jgi:hypothetical protein
MTLPNFLVIGAQKAGTTSLYYHLKHHPEVFMSAVKEPQFFAFEGGVPDAGGPGDAGADAVCDLASYAELFAAGAGMAARGEASTIYLYDEHAPARIREHVPDAKLIAILRDPAERAYSNYMHLIRDGREPITDFRAALAEEGARRELGWSANWRYLDKGFYSRQIERYLELFPRDQIRIYLYEDFDADPAPIMRDVYRFLGVRDDVTQDLSLRLNVAGVPKSRGVQSLMKRQERLKWALDPFVPEGVRRRLLKLQNRNLERSGMDADVRAELVEFYRDDILRLQRLIGADLSRWLDGSAVRAA